MSDTNTDGTEREWSFSEGDIIRQEHAPHEHVGKSEYRIERLLREESDGKRFYHVEKEEGGHHLYSAGAIEHSYEVISVSESRGWTEKTEVSRDG